MAEIVAAGDGVAGTATAGDMDAEGVTDLLGDGGGTGQSEKLR